jgi:hypothetical protein
MTNKPTHTPTLDVTGLAHDLQDLKYKPEHITFIIRAILARKKLVEALKDHMKKPSGGYCFCGKALAVVPKNKTPYEFCSERCKRFRNLRESHGELVEALDLAKDIIWFMADDLEKGKDYKERLGMIDLTIITKALAAAQKIEGGK